MQWLNVSEISMLFSSVVTSVSESRRILLLTVNFSSYGLHAGGEENWVQIFLIAILSKLPHFKN